MLEYLLFAELTLKEHGKNVDFSGIRETFIFFMNTEAAEAAKEMEILKQQTSFEI